MYRITTPLYCLLLSYGLLGQGGGSPYAAFGVGNPSVLGVGQGRALAGASVALHSSNFLNTGNPASYVALQQPMNVLLDFGLSFDLNSFATETEGDWQRDGGLSHFSFLLKPGDRYATVIGMQPYTSARYSLIAERPGFTSINTGEGGLSRIYWGHGYRLTPSTRLGLHAGYVLGSLTRRESVADFRLGSFEVVTATAYRGFNFDFGLQQEIRVGRGRLTFGLTFTAGSELRQRGEVSLFAANDSLSTKVELPDDRRTLPHEYGFGVALHDDRLMLTAEVKHTSWADIGGGEEAEWQNVNQLTLAGEYGLGTRRDFATGRQLLLRGGLSLRTGRLVLSGENPNEWVATAGLGIPYRLGKNHLNLSYSYHRRGTTASDLVLERRHSIGLGITIRDRWFERRYLN